MAAPLRQRLQAVCETIIESWTIREAERAASKLPCVVR